MKDEKKNRSKIFWMVLSLAIGFAIAMIVMTIAIFLGYNSAYNHGTDGYMVKIMGLKIYELNKVNDTYKGSSIGINMGILCMIFMVLAIVIEQVIIRIKIKSKNIK